MAYYIDTESFETTTGLWTDLALTIVAPDGFYGIDGVYRQMTAGSLLLAEECAECITTTTTTTTTTSSCGCNKYTIFADQSDLTDATGNTDPLLNGSITVSYQDCSNNLQELILNASGFYTNAICINQTTVIFMTYWKNNVEKSAVFSYNVDTGVKCCVDATTTTTSTTTTSTTTTTASYSVLRLYLDTATGTGFENPFATCYAGSPFSVFINAPGYTDFQTAYTDGKALFTGPTFSAVLNGQNRWFRDDSGNAVQVGTDGFMIAIVPFSSIGCALTTTTTSTTTTTTAAPTTTSTTTTTTTTAAPITTTSTTTTTTLPPTGCGTVVNSGGGLGYPSVNNVTMGAGTGNFIFAWATGNVPDRFIVKIGAVVILDTGYKGGSMYDFGGSLRNNFKSWLIGRIDPITTIAYPDFVNFPNDGYPRITGPIDGSVIATKSTADTFAIVDVYAPSPGTAWGFQLFCPGATTTSTTSTTTTTTASPETFRYGKLSSPGGVVPIPGAGDITILSGTLGGDPDGAINIPFNSVADDFIWFAIPSSKPTKTAWFVTVLNQGSIGGAVSQFGNLFPDPVLKTEGGQQFKLYISNYRTAVATMTIS